VLIEISLDSAPPPVPVRRSRFGRMVYGIAVLLLVAGAVHARRGVFDPVAAASESPPSLTQALVPGGSMLYDINRQDRTFVVTFSIVSVTDWPVTLTDLRVMLPAGLYQLSMGLVDVPPPGRPPAPLALPVQLRRGIWVQITLQTGVVCDRFDAIRAGPARIVVAGTVRDRAGEVDVAPEFPVRTPWWTWLSADTCGLPDESLPTVRPPGSAAPPAPGPPGATPTPSRR
jgi:hypothetical protein